ncbi:Leucyl aminopeptidase [Parvibaculum lavamentivorans DS-1]|uniref:Leucyl aminopeptidase n=1 Tax=Parvibaculum lavamentivorans (strain DS-1 / DSM 13023 / NCIMB 13966) TaxID=402881 RepID=A7HPN2_PARL1|nr:leucyl aminopeptidase family protein [Parvibaculum lavamentivorans]ABS61865.1 Leucyl aminopeptidase [Parvibaculum lavamentivorans DS-1]
MLDIFITRKDAAATPIWQIRSGEAEAWCGTHAGPGAAWVATSGFKGEAGKVLLLPDGSGGLAGVLLGLGDGSDPFVAGALASALPMGDYRFAGESRSDASKAVLGYALGTYRFTRYSGSPRDWPRLVLPENVDGEEVSRLARAIFLVRDLINTPAADMSPADLAAAAERVAADNGASFDVIEGEALLAANYPMIHAVGRAAAIAPRLIDVRWGRTEAPKVTLVGKGVCFDTGGLDLKPSNAMLLMKKDMGGAACVLALAQLIMEAKLDVRLRVLIPAVENSVSGNAFRPGDILQSRKGITVEIGNTDAEGRLVLADALSEADSEAPELIIDMATLTGAARTALGPDLPPFYTDDDTFAEEMAVSAEAMADPLWRMPLWKPYDAWLESKVADVNHVSDGPFAGSITAALFLRRFVEKAATHVHFDIYGWAPKPRPGRPVGGEAQGIRALYHLLQRRYGA